jgi:GNAT superfamily N-acetyltransferase
MWRALRPAKRVPSADTLTPMIEVASHTMKEWPKELAQIRRRAFPETFARQPPPQLIRYRGWIANAAKGRAVIGFGLCDSYADDDAALLEEVAVDPSFQCRGLGTMLVLALAEEARDHGLSTMRATALGGVGHDRRTAWLRRFGFPPYGEAPLSDVIANASALLGSTSLRERVSRHRTHSE